jgi:hypothetical protein
MVAIMTIAMVSASVIFQFTRVFFDRYRAKNTPEITPTSTSETTML